MAFDQNSVPKDLRPLNVSRNVADETHIAPSIPTTSGRPIDVYYPTINPPPPRGSVTSPPAMAVYHPDAYGFQGLGFMTPGGVVTSQVPAWTTRMPSPVGPPPTSTVSISSSGHSYSPNYMAAGGVGSGGIRMGTPSDHASEEGGDDSLSGRKVKFLCSFGGKILPRPSDGTLRYVGGQTRIISVRRDVTYHDLVQKMIDTYGQPVAIKYQLPYEDLDALVSVSCPDDLDNMMEEYMKLLESSPDGSAKLRVFLFSASELDSTGLVNLGDFQDSGHRYVDAVNGIVEGFGGGLTRKESIASAASTQNSDVSTTENIDLAQDLGGQPSTTMFSPRSDSVASNDNGTRVEASPAPLVVPAIVLPQSAPPQSEMERDRAIPLRAPIQPQFQTRMNFPPPPTHTHWSYADHRSGCGRPDFPSQVVFANPQALGAPRPVIIHPQYRDNGPTIMTQQYMAPVPVPMTITSTPTHSSTIPNVVQPLIQPQPHRVVALPSDQGYNNAYQAQVGGGYGWHQVTQQEQIAFSEGYVSHQQVVPKTSDCYMCQKALPHAHSDTVVQDQKDTHLTSASDTSPIYHSLHLDDISRIRAMAPSGMMGLGGGDVQGPHGGVMGNVPMSHPAKALNEHLVISSQLSQESTVSNDSMRIMDYMMENIQFKPPGLPSDEMKSPSDQYGETTLTNVFSMPSSLPPINQDIPPPSVVEASLQPPLDPFEGLPSNQGMAEFISPSNDMRDDATTFTMGPSTEKFVPKSNVPASISHHWGGDSVNPIYENQDLWSMRAEAHFPPKPKFELLPKVSSAKELQSLDPNQDAMQSLDGTKPRPEQFQFSKGSAEEQIKQQLQATAEEVASSVLHSSVPSDADSTLKTGDEMEGQNSDADIQTKMEALNIKPEKANFGFPMSDGMGRLQIIKNSDLEELRELGSGTFGTVYHGKWRGTDVAIKRINDRCFVGKASEQERMRDDFWNEAIKLADLHHPNVVAFYGVVLDGPGGSVATVTEYMVNGSLRTALQKNERNLDKRKRLLIAMDVAFGMEYLHAKNIVHFDLKSDNLLVNLRDPHRPICKVGDLGLSKVKCQTLISGGVRGTLPWMAPELLNGSSSLVSEKVDVFSFGIVLWELLTGEEPYADLHYGAIIGGIVSNNLRPQVPDSCDPDWKILMERCWSAEPSERPNFTEIANELRSMAAKVPPKGQTPVATAKPSA